MIRGELITFLFSEKQFIGGCEDGPSDGKGLMTLYAKGQLIPLLKEAGAFINQNMHSPGRKEEPVG